MESQFLDSQSKTINENADEIYNEDDAKLIDSQHKYQNNNDKNEKISAKQSKNDIDKRKLNQNKKSELLIPELDSMPVSRKAQNIDKQQKEIEQNSKSQQNSLLEDKNKNKNPETQEDQEKHENEENQESQEDQVNENFAILNNLKKIEDEKGEKGEKREKGENSEVNIQKEDLPKNLTEKAMEKIVVLYESLINLHGKLNQESDNNLTEEFENYVKEVLDNLKTSLKHESTAAAKNGEIYKSISAIFDLCSDKFIDYLSFGNKELSTIVKLIKEGYDWIIEGLTSQAMESALFSEIKLPNNQLHYNNNESKELEKQNEELKKQNEKLSHEIQLKLNEISQKDMAITKLKITKNLISQEVQTEKSVRNRLSPSSIDGTELKEENLIMGTQNKNIPKSQDSKNSVDFHDIPNFQNSQNLQNLQNMQKINEFEEQLDTFQVEDETNQIDRITIQENQENLDNLDNRKYLGNQQNPVLDEKPYGLNNQIVSAQQRFLTLKQLKEIINDIYFQKQKFDEKCKEGHQPRLTLEQYLFTYLNQQYGLKTIIIEWASAIINGIKKYSLEDNDVALFGKILRNECEEDFRIVQMKIKDAIFEIVKDRFKRIHKMKTDTEINKIVNEVQKGFLDEQTWVEVIKKMYNKDHSEILKERIRKIISENKNNTLLIDSNMKRMTRIEQNEKMRFISNKDLRIQYFEFQKVLLDFQLKSHERYLKKFLNLFKQIDKDTNGILNEEEFIQLVEMMQIEKIDKTERTEKTEKTGKIDRIDRIESSDRLRGKESLLSRLLPKVDPYNHQQISFSDCITLFSNEYQSKDKIKSILELFISRNEQK